MAKKEYKLDMFEVIRQAEMKNYDYFSKLSDDQKKEFSPWLAMRFMSASMDGYDAISTLLMTDFALNQDFSVVSKDKELFYRLMCVVGEGSSKKHFMVKPPKKRIENPLVFELFKDFFNETMEEIEIINYIKINELDKFDIEDFAYSLGWDDDRTKEVKKSFVNMAL